MILHTASEIISLARKLETDSASFYEALADKFGRTESSGFAAENGKNIKQFERAYYSSISDALEGTFAFELEADDYAFDTDVPDDYPAALEKAAAFERTVISFYEATGHSQALMADVQRVFRQLAKKREARLDSIAAMTAGGKGNAGG